MAWTMPTLFAGTALMIFNPGVAVAAQAAETIVTTLATHKTFRMTLAEVEKLLTPYCKKTSSNEDTYDQQAEYTCGKESGIRDIRIGERKNNKQAGTFIQYLSLSLAPDSYAPWKKQLEVQLGRPDKSGKDFLSWSYTADKKLNTIGYPVISLTQDGKQKSTTFNLGVEAGP